MAKEGKTTEKEIIIPKEGETSVAGFAFSDNKKIETVVICEGVTEIEYFAFNDCKNLTSVTLPSTLKKICEDAFNGCSKLTHITLPDGLEFIGERAFKECSSLTEIHLPNSIKKLEDDVFEKCRNLKKVVLPKSLDQLPRCCFFNASALEEVVFPEKMQSLGYGSFSDCTALSSVELPEGIEELDAVFRDCTNLKSIKLPKSLKKINQSAFEGCVNLKEVEIPANVECFMSDSFPPTTQITISPDNPYISLNDGFLLSADGKILISCMIDTETVKTPESVIEIAKSAFSRSKNLASITLGKNVTKLSDSCFCYCTSLKKVVFEGNITSIGADAFYECTKLEEITLPDSLQTIEGEAFRVCKKLKNITIPASVESVGHYAFAESGLTKVTILSKGKLGARAFAYCNSLKQIEIPFQTMDGFVFEECKKLSSVTFLDSVSKIGKDIFSDCAQLSTIKVAALNREVDTKNFLDYNREKEILLDGDDKSWLDEQDNEIAQLRKSAEKGDAEAQNKLGWHYFNGDKLPQSFELAAEWWTKAALQGDAKAQYNLGCSYDDGDGVPQNSKKAVEWYTKAAQQGHAGAQNNLGWCYYTGNGVAQNYELATEWYQKAAEQGNSDAQTNLGCCYFNGEGVDEDYELAEKWFQKAAKQGDKNAKKNLKILKESKPKNSANAPKLTDEMLGVLCYKKERWMGKATANFSGKEIPLEIELERTEKEGISELQRQAYAEYLQKQEAFFETLQQKAKENFKTVGRRKKENKIVPFKLHIAADGNYGWYAVKEWDGESIAVILSDNDVQMAENESILYHIAEVKANRTKKDWHFGDTAYLNLFGLLTDLSITTSGESEDGEALSEKEVELLMWLTTEFDTNNIKKKVLDYCNETYESWGGDTISADDLHKELSLSSIYLRVEDAEDSESQPDICLSGDCNCDEEHGIAIAFKNKKLFEINEESIAF